MKAVGIAVALAAIVTGGIFFLNLSSGQAAGYCAEKCPKNPEALVTYFDFGWVKLRQCKCPED